MQKDTYFYVYVLKNDNVIIKDGNSEFCLTLNAEFKTCDGSPSQEFELELRFGEVSRFENLRIKDLDGKFLGFDTNNKLGFISDGLFVAVKDEHSYFSHLNFVKNTYIQYELYDNIINA